jgi:hypothetical protein
VTPALFALCTAVTLGGFVALLYSVPIVRALDGLVRGWGLVP